MSMTLEKAIVAALASATPPKTLPELRRAVGASAAEVRDLVRSMRFKGKILFDRLALSPSMSAEAAAGEVQSIEEPAVGLPVPSAPAVLPSAAGAPSDVELEAKEAGEARRRVRSTGTVKTPISIVDMRRTMALSLIEEAQTVCAETPRDVVLAVSRKHPELWQRSILLGRELGVQPAVAMFQALEVGLGQMEAARG